LCATLNTWRATASYAFSAMPSRLGLEFVDHDDKAAAIGTLMLA
jgi:hypothetical protein